MENEYTTKILLRKTMERQWDDVIEIYKQHPEVHQAKITRPGDTALHIAVAESAEDIVEQLVTVITNSGNTTNSNALEARNELGNTALHQAASFGTVKICELIAGENPKLVGVRNNEGETPLLLAALHGHKKVFRYLHLLCLRIGDDSRSYCTNNKNGDTILHCAIAGDHFELAFQIIHLYGHLAGARNGQGLTPLHLLASKPAAFKSGSYLTFFHNIVYHSTFVDELEVEKTNCKPLLEDSDGVNNSRYPENYKTCINFFGLLRIMFRVLFNIRRNMQQKDKQSDVENPQERGPVPPNYQTCFETIKLVSKALLIILGLGYGRIAKIQENKEKHTWSLQIVNELLQRVSMYEYDYNGQNPQPFPTYWDGENLNDESLKRGNIETPILVAAKNGVAEMVERILLFFPMAIHDTNSDKKNVVLLAVEHRQPHVFQLLLKRKNVRHSIFHTVDAEGNSALHLAATLGDYKPWLIPGAALQLQWEIKWYEFVKSSFPPHFFAVYNKKGKTPKVIFIETHKELLENGSKWLTNTSESCSVVAALIATVAFATSATVPGGVKQDSGTPTLEGQTAFDIFAVSSLVALCFSVTAVVMFLAMLTSRYDERDFGKDLPQKLLVGLTSLFVSIAAILISFCAGHFFEIKDKLHYAVLPVYAVTCLPVTLFAMAQFPLYIDLIRAITKKVPQRSYKVLPG